MIVELAYDKIPEVIREEMRVIHTAQTELQLILVEKPKRSQKEDFYKRVKEQLDNFEKGVKALF